MTVPPKFTLEYHEPGRNDPCVCGSGIKFKKCCARTYSAKASGHFKDAYNSGDFASALLSVRSHFTWYVLCHKAHTVPFLESKTEAAKDLLRVDIEALAALLHYLHQCYFRTGRSNEFPNVIDHVSGVIQDERWSDKIAYTRALWNLVDRNDEEAASAALQPIDIKSCEDPEILAIFLQVNARKLTLSTSISMADRIIKHSPSQSYRFQYSIVKGLRYYLVCQPGDGSKIIEDAIDKYKQLADDEKSAYGDRLLANALEMYGKFTGRMELVEEAEKHVRKLLKVAEEEKYPNSYRAELLKLLGDCLEWQGKHVEASAAYTSSIETEPSELSKVFLARSICNSGDHSEARRVLEAISQIQLDEAGKFDLAISWALVAVNSLSLEDLEEAKRLMKAAESQYPMFIQQRDRWIIELLETKPKAEPGNLRKLIQSLNRYVTLNPNFFGIGINFNRIIEDAESPPEQKKV